MEIAPLSQKYTLPKLTWSLLKELHLLRDPPTHRGTRAHTRMPKTRCPRNDSTLQTVIRPRRDVVPRGQNSINSDNLVRVTISHSNHCASPNLPSFLLCNTRSAYNKFDELSITILDHDIDVCAITETWFKHDLPSKVVTIPGFTMFAKSRLDRNGGGVAIYAKHHLNPSLPKDIVVPTNLEVVWIKLRPQRLPRSITCIFCAVIYYPQPDHSVETQLTEHIITTMDELSTDHPDAGFVILGDFNQLNTDPLLTDQRYRQIVDRPTRGEHILDKIITNISSWYADVQIKSPIGMSDHNTLLWSPKTVYTKQPNKTRYRHSRPMPDSAVRGFGAWIADQDWTEVTIQVDVNSQLEGFTETLNSAIDKYFPIRKVKLHSCDKPWMSAGIKSLLRERQTAFHRGDLPNWKRLRNKVKSSIDKAKTEYYSSRVQRLKQSNSAAWYREIRVLTGGQRSHAPIHVPGISSDDHLNIADTINKLFISQSSDLNPLDLSALPAYLPAPTQCPTLYPWEVHKVMSKVRQKTSGGPDGISARIVREFLVELATPLTHIINTSFQQGTVPDEWKRAIVVPIPKGSPPSVDKLRPISLTDHFAKIAESFVARWTLHDLTPTIDAHQFGNRKSLSTSHCLINMLHPVYANAEKPKTSSSVILTDYTKAFDRIDHTIAISKLIDLGVRSCIIPWICDFLSSRQQCVRYRSICSEWSTLNAGVPQGTRLGPIIFLAMINDVHPSDQIHTFKYVDDLTLVECRQANQRSNMQLAVNNLAEWSDQNRMKLNPTKCVKMDISFMRNPQVQPNVVISNHHLATVSNAKVLGVNIQSDVKWESHVKFIEKRANGKLYMLRLLKRYGLPCEDLLTVYVGYVRPVTEYAAPVWSGALTKHQQLRIE